MGHWGKAGQALSSGFKVLQHPRPPPLSVAGELPRAGRADMAVKLGDGRCPQAPIVPPHAQPANAREDGTIISGIAPVTRMCHWDI